MTINDTNNTHMAPDALMQRGGRTFAGMHVVVDLYGAERLDDIAHIEAVMKRCVGECGATLLHIHLHHFTPNDGVTGVAVLAESHISVHTWPERKYAAFDVFMCGHAEPEKAIDILRREFQATQSEVKTLYRGEGQETQDDEEPFVPVSLETASSEPQAIPAAS